MAEHTVLAPPPPPPFLRAVGFCGVDDSIHPKLLVLLAQAYPLIEFGVLFRPDKEGTPRYATMEWVKQLSTAAKALSSHYNDITSSSSETTTTTVVAEDDGADGEPRRNDNNNNTTTRMRLAAHLCGTRVDDILNGDTAFLQRLVDWGFGRIQINATAINGVDTRHLAEKVATFLPVVHEYPFIEFILQKNEETKPLWNGILQNVRPFPANISMLIDESKGTGTILNVRNTSSSSSDLQPDDYYDVGFAGGIGPANVRQIVTDIMTSMRTVDGTSSDAQQQQRQRRTVWIDMESSLRSIQNGKDVFDINKCFDVIETICDMGLMTRPPYMM